MDSRPGLEKVEGDPDPEHARRQVTQEPELSHHTELTDLQEEMEERKSAGFEDEKNPSNGRGGAVQESCMAFPGSMALVPARFGALRVQMTPGLHVALKQSTLPRSPEKTAKICNSDYVLGKWRNNEIAAVASRTVSGSGE